MSDEKCNICHNSIYTCLCLFCIHCQEYKYDEDMFNDCECVECYEKEIDKLTNKWKGLYGVDSNM